MSRGKENYGESPPHLWRWPKRINMIGSPGERAQFSRWTPLKEQTGRDLTKGYKRSGPEKNSSLHYLFYSLYLCFTFLCSIFLRFLHLYIFYFIALSLYIFVFIVLLLLIAHILSSLRLSKLWLDKYHLCPITLKSELWLIKPALPGIELRTPIENWTFQLAPSQLKEDRTLASESLGLQIKTCKFNWNINIFKFLWNVKFTKDPIN